MLTSAQRAAGWTFLALFVFALFWTVMAGPTNGRYSDPDNGCQSYACEVHDWNGP